VIPLGAPTRRRRSAAPPSMLGVPTGAVESLVMALLLVLGVACLCCALGGGC
jgi:hypothetical protein